MFTASSSRMLMPLLALFAFSLVAGCDGAAPIDSGFPGPQVASVSVSSDTTVQLNQTMQLSATAKDAEGNALFGRAVSWTSSENATATVSPLGLVTGRAPGVASISAASEGESDSAMVTVTGGSPEDPPRSSFYVAPAGAPGGSGDAAHPWALAYALGQPAAVQPGDTIWLRGGSYRGAYTSRLNGQKETPIVVRQCLGERAVIDGTLRVDGANAAYWGFEVTSTTLNPADVEGISVYGPGNRFINLVVHDRGGNGLGLWEGAVDAEVYGTIIYNNGRQAYGGAAHGIYAQNATGTKRLVNNIIFNQFGYGIHVYAEGGQIQGFDVVGNVAFNNGAPGPERVRPNIFIGSPSVSAARVSLVSNMTYTSPSLRPAGAGKTVEFGYGSANADITLRNNYFVGGDPVMRFRSWRDATVTGNTFYSSARMIEFFGSGTGFQWSGNTWYRSDAAQAWMLEDRAYSWPGWRSASGLGAGDQISGLRPTGVKVVIEPNQYEPGRAAVVVYNWTGQSSVGVDLSGVLRIGQAYEVRNVQTLFERPVLSGTYQGGAVPLPLDAVAPPRPIGGSPGTPPATGPEFGVFVVLPQ